MGEPYFVPGTPITIDRKGMQDAEVGDLVSVSKGRGRARVERVIGPAKAVENVLEALLVEKGLREGFEPHDLPKPSFEGRTDLRDLHTFTIDPETAKDFDDAISVRAEGDGLRVWVHIADVSYFVPAGSPLDRGAAERANSVYVPASSRRCSRTRSPTTPARCGRTRTGSQSPSRSPSAPTSSWENLSSTAPSSEATSGSHTARPRRSLPARKPIQS